MKKINFLAVSMLLSAASAFAGVNERGIDLYRAELFDAAKLEFLNQSGGTPVEQAERYYFLGQTYSELKDMESASDCYAKATAIAPEYPFGYIGQGELALAKGDLKAADDLFKKAIGLAKKDASVSTAVAESYIEFDKKAEAEAALVKAKKANKNFPGRFLAEGDAIFKNDAGKVGAAAASYEQALYFDANNKLALLKLARIYKTVNPTESLRFLAQLVEIDPDYIPAYALIGDINRDKGQYGKALDAYKKFIAIPGVPIEQHEHYAELLYWTEQYDKSLEKINEVLAQNPTKVVVAQRFQAWNNYKLENYSVALEQMAQFLKDTPTEQHLYMDYSIYGNILLKLKQYEGSIEALQKAVELAENKDRRDYREKNKSGAYKELESAYEMVKNYPAAIEQYEKYFAVVEQPDVLDYYWYGMANRSAASKYLDGSGEEEFALYIAKGEKAFDKVIEGRSESYLGYLSKAQLLSLVDAREQAVTGAIKGAARESYEKALEVMLANNDNGKRNGDIIEAYNFLGSYYALSFDKTKNAEDKENAGLNLKKTLEIDPENAYAKSILESLKIKY